jgi:hypothetical protein
MVADHDARSHPEMTHVTTQARLERWLGPLTAQRLAAGTYGLIIGAAVLVAAGGGRKASVTVSEVCVSLAVYWLAEMYAEFLGHHAAGERLGFGDVRAAIRQGLAMIELSALPLVALLLSVAAGSGVRSASTVALVVTALLLAGLGFLAGTRHTTSLRGRIGMALGAGLIGALMIALKVALH